MESGTVIQWLVDDGVEVTLGQPVMLIETDKVESEVESTGAGVLRHVGEAGMEYPCGDQIGWLLEPGEEPPAVAASAAPTAAPAAAVAAAPTAAPTSGSTAHAGGRLLASPNAKRIAKARGIDLRLVAGTGPGGRITSEDVPASAPAPTPAPVVASAGSAGVLATAAGRQLAELLGVDLAKVPSNGPDARVGRDDVAAYVRSLIASATGPVAPLLQTPTSVTPMRGMRGTIAERMSESLHSMAQLTLHMDVDMDAVVADRAIRKTAGAAPGYTDYIIAAVAGALADHPFANSQIIDDGVAELPAINIGLAVALDDGLIVPVAQDVPAMTLDELSVETTRLAAAARKGKLALSDLEGCTFSVTSLGMFDVDGFTPIINSPNTAILGVGRLRDDVAWDTDGQPVKASRLTLSLTWDHRAFDGAPAADFCRTVKRRLEGLELGTRS